MAKDQLQTFKLIYLIDTDNCDKFGQVIGGNSHKLLVSISNKTQIKSVCYVYNSIKTLEPRF